MSDGSGEATVFQQLGEYRLVEELGESELFRVFKARHDKLQRDVVVKFLRHAHDPHALSRFRREMKAVGSIEHPNIVWASDAGEHHGTPYIVMEYLAGQTLQQLIAANGPLQVADACELARQAAAGLYCVHDHQMVHRDVKPSNLLVTDDGVVKLLDFGLIRLAQDCGESDELTAAATALGTPDYIAPEQASDSRSVDFRADIYSLGCTLYEMLTGAPPFAGAGQETPVKKLLAHTRTLAPPVQAVRPDVPLELSNLLHRMLAKAPANRPGSVAEVIAALAPLSSGQQVTALLKAQEHAGKASRNSSTQSVNLSPTIEWTSGQKQRPEQPAARRWRIPAVALA